MKKIIKLLGILLTAGIVVAAVFEKLHEKHFQNRKFSAFLIRKKKKPILFPKPEKNQAEGKIVKFQSRPISGHYKYSWKRFFYEKPAAVAILMLVVTSFFFQDELNNYSFWLRVSLTGLEPAPFTGTVAPIKKVANWVALTDSERKMSYETLPSSKLIPLPEYNTATFQRGKVWQRDNKIERNAYLTYPVPNLGNYKLDGTEYSGSHPGVDIKTPLGTPVYATANGIVFKAANQRTGFGKHIIIMHIGAPDPKNPEKKTTLYSAYAHLSEILVREGDKVTKGQLIGRTGQTGMATGPHLHFQIDRPSAPFHLYWPFSWADLRAANISSYFDAVKQGFGQKKALINTIHPINFYKQFSNYVGGTLVASAGDPVINSSSTMSSRPNGEEKTKSVKDPLPTPKTTAPPPTRSTQPNRPTTIQKNVKTPTTNTAQKTSEENIRFETNRIFVPGEEKVVKILVDNANLVAQAGIEISSSLRQMADLTPKKLFPNDFKNGIAEIRVKTDSNRTFKLIAKGDFGQIKSKSLRAQVFRDVEPDHRASSAIKYLKEKKIVKGYSDGTFRPEGTLNRAEAVKMLITANDIQVLAVKTDFTDIPSNAWFADYVGTALANGIVRGYSDSTFRPGNRITRAEFLKVAIETAELDPKNVTKNPYDDVPADAWFGKYFAFRSEEHTLNSSHIPLSRMPSSA